MPTIAATVRPQTHKGTSTADTSGDSAAHEAPRCRTEVSPAPSPLRWTSGTGSPWGPRTDDAAARGYSPPRNRRRRPTQVRRRRTGYFPHDAVGMRGVPERARILLDVTEATASWAPPGSAGPPCPEARRAGLRVVGVLFQACAASSWR